MEQIYNDDCLYVNHYNCFICYNGKTRRSAGNKKPAEAGSQEIEMNAIEFEVDMAEINKSLEAILRLFEPGLFERVPKVFFDRLLGLLDGGGMDIRVTSCGAAAGTGNHVIRLGVFGLLEELAAAAAAMEFDVGHV